jgi:preprotein translocase subunit SecD
MDLRPLIAAIGLVVACGTDHAQPEQVLPSRYALQMKAVDDSSTRMQQLYERVPIDRPEGIAGAVDHWRTEDGVARSELYLTGPSPEAIESYLAREPKLSVPTDRELAFQQLDGQRWRTYLLVPTVELDAASIAHARATVDPDSSRPTVILELTSEGAHQLADVTARIAGHKLAVLVDGRVIAAPVINDAITGGRAAITLDAHATQATANALAQALDHK